MDYLVINSVAGAGHDPDIWLRRLASCGVAAELLRDLDPREACRTVAAGVVPRVDVGRVGDDVFLSVAHVGLGSEIGRDVLPTEKRWRGRFSYLR